jgi:glycosyltransferase involved in cell wall biosynthesis
VSIVFLSPTGQTGGAELALLEILAGLRDRQPSWKLTLIAASDGPLIGRVEALGVPVRIVPFPVSLARLGDWGTGAGPVAKLRLFARCATASIGTLGYLRRLKTALRVERPTVIHTNGFKMHILGVWACPTGSRVLWHIHDFVSRRQLMARLLRRYARRCSAAVANSQSVAADLRAVCGSDLAVHSVWNAVDLERFSPDGPRVDLDTLSNLPPAQGVIRVGLVATFARWKGHHVFLQALARLPRSVNVRGYVIGGPVYDTAGSQVSLDELRARTAALGLESRIGFTGFVTDVAAAMRSLDIVVHASTEPEPFGLVIAEAMACGRPILVSRAGGAVELIETNGSAVPYTPGDAGSLARAIEQLAASVDRRRELGQAGRVAAEQNFTRARLMQQLVPVYQSLANPQ